MNTLYGNRWLFSTIVTAIAFSLDYDGTEAKIARTNLTRYGDTVQFGQWDAAKL